MTGLAATPGTPRRRRWADVAITAVIGLVVVSAALLPAVTASSGETVTVSGDVTLDGRPLQFFPVGFWTPSNGVVSTSSTDASGRFTIDVSATLDGFAYAGSAPDSTRAVVQADGVDVVRGLIGAEVQPGISTPTYQGRTTATARGLSGGATEVHLRLQRAGRIAGTSPVPGSALRAVQVRRADNSVVQTLRLDGSRRFRSMALAPGQYGLVLVPKSPNLPVVANAVVQGGRTTTVAPGTPQAGATLTGTVRTPTGVVRDVPVLLEQDGEVLAATRSSDEGDWSFPGVAAGDYEVEVGRYDEPAASSASASAVDVQIPGATATPTPTFSTATPSPTPTAPETAAIQPVERTSDAVIPQVFPVTVPSVLGDVGVVTDVDAAGRITGVVTRPSAVTGTETAPVRIVVEEAATERIVRSATAGADGRYGVGGLQPGARYRVWAVTEPDDPTLAEMGGTTVTASTTGSLGDVEIDRAALTVNGTVSGATAGRVRMGDEALFSRTGTIDASGAYAVQGLVPGGYPAVVTTPKRMTSTPVGVAASQRQPVVDLQPGPRPATFKGWFIASGAGVPVVTGTASDSEGDVITFGPATDGGQVEVPLLRPGTYEYDADSFRGTVPAADGPWYYAPPTGTFSLSDGATTDVGPIVLRARAH